MYKKLDMLVAGTKKIRDIARIHLPCIDIT